MENFQNDKQSKIESMLQIVILAAGRGSRMGSDLPKVMHKINNIPMLELVLNNALSITSDVVLVLSPFLRPYLNPYVALCRFALQTDYLGTASAVNAAMHLIAQGKYTMVLYGDHPLITDEIIKNFFNYVKTNKAAVATLAFSGDTEKEYGRIILNQNGEIEKIIEYKQASEEEKSIRLYNSGMMCFSPTIITKYLPLLIKHHHEQKNTGEIYLTSMLQLCKSYSEKAVCLVLEGDQANHLVGVNTLEELKIAEEILAKKYAKNN